MIAFQINMSIGHFTSEYLKKWLKTIAENGYDTIIWEVEDAVRWDTCPGCAAPEAFTKDEFRRILSFASDLGLAAVPLLQTLAHCEYVLKQKKYEHLAEHPGFVELYCPCNPDVHEFLNKWIAEYIDLFGDIKYFHMGADEGWALGGKYCDGKCPEYLKTHSKAELFVQHIMKFAQPLLDRGITPIVWADMLLKHPEALKLMPRDILLFDWMYEIRNDIPKVYIWENEKGLCSEADIPEDVKVRYHKYLYPPELNGNIDPFYTVRLLKDNGFSVVGCPASSSYGDNVFAPRTRHHMANTTGWAEQYVSGKTDGFALTSWSVHLFPYEMQLPCILIPSFLSDMSNGLESVMTIKMFGKSVPAFFDAAENLSGRCLFSYTSTLGFSTCHHVIKKDHISTTIRKLSEKGKLEEELENCRVQLEKYKTALSAFGKIRAGVSAGHDLLDLWILQSKNMINRAKASAVILEYHISGGDMRKLSFTGYDVESILSELRSLKSATSAMYDGKVKTSRRSEMISWMFDAVERELAAIGDRYVK